MKRIMEYQEKLSDLTVDLGVITGLLETIHGKMYANYYSSIFTSLLTECSNDGFSKYRWIDGMLIEEGIMAAEDALTILKELGIKKDMYILALSECIFYLRKASEIMNFANRPHN